MLPTRALSDREVPARTCSRSGFSMVEVVIAITVFAIGAGAVTTSLVTTNALNRTKRERSLAADAGASAIEALKGVAFSEVFARFNSDGSDDPEGANTAPGAAFAVDGLTPRDDDLDGLVGEILFPGGPKKILEKVDDVELGMPRDLGGDDGIDAKDHAEDYEVLPVRVRLRWKGEQGDQQLDFVTVLTDL